MTHSTRNKLGIGLLLIGASLVNRYASGELLTLEPLAIGSGGLDSERIADEVERISRALNIKNCLPRAVVLRDVLRKNGVDAVVHIGAAYEKQFWGHAWIKTANAEYMKEGELQTWLVLPLRN